MTRNLFFLNVVLKYSQLYGEKRIGNWWESHKKTNYAEDQEVSEWIILK
jgi:hypothetical protein